MPKETDNFPMPLDWSPRLASLRSTRTTYSRLVREFAAGRISREDMRVWSYIMSTMLTIVKAETDEEANKKIIEIEQRLGELEADK
jgi:hypothetical protein